MMGGTCGRLGRAGLLGAMALCSICRVYPPAEAATTSATPRPGWRIILAKLSPQNRFERVSPVHLIAIQSGATRTVRFQTPSGGMENIPLRRVVSLTRIGFANVRSSRLTVYLKDGSYLLGRSIMSHGNRFHIHTAFGTVDVPLGAATGLGTSDPTIVRRRAAAHDRVVLASGSMLKGTFLACDQGGIELHTSLGNQTIAWSRINRLILGGLPTQMHQRPSAEVSLLDGSRLKASAMQLANGRLVIHTPGGFALSVPQSMVGKMTNRDGDVSWLAAMTPTAYQQTPLFGRPWPMGKNRNVVGGKLRADGVNYAHGIGLHAPCSVTYEPGGRFKYLVFSAQMDDSAGKVGRGEVKIQIDGRQVYSSGILRAGGPAVFVKLPIQGTARLVITTRSAGFPATRCRVDLLDAAFIRR